MSSNRSPIETGLSVANYHDYEDDDTAIARELEISEEVVKNWEDPAFPSDGRSLYFDPLNPPRGAIPEQSIKWSSISLGELVNCNNPTLFKNDTQSSFITQGALGDNYFVNALRLIASDGAYLKRLLVSRAKARAGIYTFKFYKSGAWRYVHVDDRIPCRHSGAVNFCSNVNPNETFAMLLEKAYAKLHGSYEGIAFGLVEKALQDMSYAASVEALRTEVLGPDAVVERVWEALERGNEEKRLLGCARLVPDPYSEDAADRKGVAVAHMYQVVDVRACTAIATEELDQLDVGMVCIRNLTQDSGRWTGRWGYGDMCWVQYPAIGEELMKRTNELLMLRGLKPFDPAESLRKQKSEHEARQSASRPKSAAKKKGAATEGKEGEGGEKGAKHVEGKLGTDIQPEAVRGRVGNGDATDEPDNLALDYVSRMGNSMIRFQPRASDLHWLQIEDFVEVFNRSFVVDDAFVDPAPVPRSGAVTSFLSKWMPGDFVAGSGGQPTIPHSAMPVEKEDDEDEGEGEGDTKGDGDDEGEGGASKPAKESLEDEDEDGEATAKDPNRRILNPSFTDNPMYPFSANEPTTLRVTLVQPDKRFSVGRLGDDPRDMGQTSFMTRNDRLATCMRYDTGIGFLVCKLSGMKMRVTTFKLKKLAGGCEAMEWSNSCSGSVRLRPGRYALIPYTDIAMDEPTEYKLVCSYKEGAVDFEIKDILVERPIDEVLSESEGEEEGLDNDEEEEDERSDAGMSLNMDGVLAPGEFRVPDWEWTEDTENMGLVGLYSEVGVVARDLAAMRTEMKRLQATLQIRIEQQAVIDAEAAAVASEAAALKASRRRK